jgi:hypothetical protein
LSFWLESNKKLNNPKAFVRIVFLVLTFLGSASLAIAQDTWGKVFFSNRNIPIAAGGSTGGGNGNGTYDVPILYLSPMTGAPVGAGVLPGGVAVGLFKAGAGDGDAPLASTLLRNTSTYTSRFFATVQEVAIPGVLPGETTILMVRAWQGPSFETAKNSGGQYPWSEWTFSTQPLGGVPPAGGAEIPTPDMTGWGPEDGSGFVLGPQILFTGIISPVEGSVFVAPATVQVFASWYSEGNVQATNLSIFANSTQMSSQTPTFDGDYQMTLTAGPLGVGNYSLTTIMKGTWGTGATSAPVNITVVEAIPVAVSLPRVQGSQFAFEYSVNPGLKYLIQSSSDLLTWQPVLTNVLTANPAQFIDGYSSENRRFYRVGRLPNP